MASLGGLSDKIKNINKLFKLNITENSSRDDLTTVFDITWGAKYLFMVRLQGGLESPLDNFIIPASSVNESLTSIVTQDIPLPNRTGFKIPVQQAMPEINVTMYDTEDCIIERSLRSWLLEIHDGAVTNYLEDSTRVLTIYKLNFERDIVFTTNYEVIPTGDIKIEMSSRDSSAREISMNFSVVGYTN